MARAISCPKVHVWLRESQCRPVPFLAGGNWSIDLQCAGRPYSNGKPERGTGTMFGWKQTRAALRGLQEDRSGIAALEFAFFAGFLSLGIVNLSDVGVYLSQ